MESDLLYNEISVPDFVNYLFSNSPLEPCSYNLFPIETTNETETMFPILMNIMMTGAKILYGENITPQTMTTDQFDTLKKYILSFGYQVENNYTTVLNKQYINIWFKRVNIIVDCKGNKIIKYN